MRKWLFTLHTWLGRKLYKGHWPPMLIVVLTPKEDVEEVAPKVFH